MKTWYRLRAARKSAELLLYEEIGAFGVSSKYLVAQLESLGEITDLTVRINSPGGDVFDALAIHNALSRHPARVVACIDALCASAATLVALSSDEVRMADNGQFMIHEPWTVAMGNSAELLKQSDLLDTIAQQIVGIYTRKTGADPDTVREWMRAETWYTAEQALAAGFVDVIDEPFRLAALISHSLTQFRNRPLEKLPMTDETTVAATPDIPVPAPDPTPEPTQEPAPEPVSDAADQVAISQMCLEQKEPGLIPLLLASRLNAAQVQARIDTAREIRQICARVHLPELADGLISSGQSAEQAKVITWNALAARSEQNPVDGTPPDRKTAITRATLETLTPQARAEFFRAGGRVTD